MGNQFERRPNLEGSASLPLPRQCSVFTSCPGSWGSRTKAAQSELPPTEEAASPEHLPDAGHGCPRGRASICAHVINCPHCHTTPAAGATLGSLGPPPAHTSKTLPCMHTHSAIRILMFRPQWLQKFPNPTRVLLCIHILKSPELSATI